MAKTKPTTRAARVTEPPAPAGLRWPLWAAATLGVLYLYNHLEMIPVAFSLWGGLLSALVFGK